MKGEDSMKKYLSILLGTLLITSGVYAADVPSDWASADINSAAARSIVDNTLLNNYKAPVTRREFCSLCADTVKA